MQRLLRYGERFDVEKMKFEVDEDKEKEDVEKEICLTELTRKEVLKVMNYVNDDLKFTMELCKDFPEGRLPTLAFSLWADKEGLKHTYFEKSMRNQVLLLERTSMSRQSLNSILSNELRRRLEVLDDHISDEEANLVIEKFVQQMVNSEFTWKQIHEIVISSLRGHVRREKRRKKLGKPRFRSGKESLESRIEKKLTEKYNWFREKKKLNNSDEDDDNSDYIGGKARRREEEVSPRK